MNSGYQEIRRARDDHKVDRAEIIAGTGKDTLLRIYRDMVRTRCLDDKIEELLQRGFSIIQHSTTGQEATPIASCAALEASDYVMPYHRGWAWAIGKGMDPREILAELMGRKTGCCRGKGGPHLADFHRGVMGRPGIQGAHISIAAGVGLSAKMRKSNQVVACFFGNGASNTGSFHEGLNLASVWKAPVVFLCENNLYALFSNLEDTTSVKNISDRAVAYGMPGYLLDGNDAVMVYHVASKALSHAREGKGPSLIETMTYRLMGHTALDRLYYGGYRPKEEVDEWRKKCPIERLGRDLLEHNLAREDELEAIKAEAKDEMDKAAEFAKESPYPSREDYFADIYSS